MGVKVELKGREVLTKRLEQIAPNVAKYAAQAKLEIGQEAARQMAGAAPKKSGEYAASIHAEKLDGNNKGQQVGVNASKDADAVGIFAHFTWRFLEFGTRAHVIKAKGGGLLRFVARDGTKVATKQVNHPATAARPHIFTTWRAMKKKARRKLLAAVNKGVKEAMGK